MKAIRYGCAVGIISLVGVTAIVVPAQAQTVVWDVCVDLADFFLDDANADGGVISAGDGFTAVAPIFPGDTIPVGGVASCADITAERIGTFFARGRVVAGLPSAEADDFAYVDWQFRIDGIGELETTGAVKAAPVYPHTIIGTTYDLYPDNGEMLVEVLDTGGFQISVSFELEGDDDGNGGGNGGGGDGTVPVDCNNDGVVNGLDIIGAGC